MWEYLHIGVTIYTTLSNIFNKYKINKSIFSIAFDNAKSNVKVVGSMIKHLNLPFEKKIFNIRYAYRIMNLIAWKKMSSTNN